MSYSIDLRKRAVSFVNEGGSRTEAARIFGVSRKTLYHWLHRDDLTPRKAETRRRKLDKAALLAHVQAHPDLLLRERAQLFNVHESSISRALARLRIVKKNDTLRGNKSQ